MVMGYWWMLIVMLYETIFFIALVLGLVIGHGVFSIYLPAKKRQLIDPKRSGNGVETKDSNAQVSVFTPCCR